MKKIILLIVLFAACSTVPVKTEYGLTKTEIQNVLENDKNLTAEQKVILKHAVVALNNAEAESRENVKLEKRVIADSKLAGAGKMIYVIIGVMVLGSIIYVMLKISSKIPL